MVSNTVDEEQYCDWKEASGIASYRQMISNVLEINLCTLCSDKYVVPKIVNSRCPAGAVEV